jgi:uncharacterized protein YecE (DUF72 family)
MRRVRVGCSGWSYPDWRGHLYPEGLPQSRWLERYAEEFDTVEVNNTFYRLPTRKAVRGWVERTPDRFLFSVKASRYLTHVKRLRAIGTGFRRFYAPLRPLADAGKLGPILWQLPETFQRDDQRLESALERLRESRHAFEFRHPSWFDPTVYALLRDHGAALVIGVHPERPFQEHELTTDWTLVRFHHGRSGRRGNYSERELERWRRRIAAWRARAEVLAYFNNDWEGFAVRNARWLRDRLS